MTAVAANPQFPLQNVEEDNQEKLLADIEKSSVSPLWTQMKRLNPPLPNPQAIPFIWKCNEIRPNLLRAGNLVTEKQAERRVLMLVNPKKVLQNRLSLRIPIYAGLQLVMPNETAPAHRHTAFAMRFIIEGEGGFTAIHGRRVNMKRGDVILTPTWNWHDRGKDGSGPMIWLDGLELPNFVHFPVHFVEHHTAARYPTENINSGASPIVFPWAKMQAKLDAAPVEWISKPYLQSDGTEVSRILGGSAERLEPGKASPAFRETTSSVYHVVEGSGYTEVEGNKLTWERGDTFCIPAWHRYQHFNTGGERVYLYRFDDKPMLKALGFYRTDQTDSESLSTSWTAL
ncbi:RmlC-like cupin domain-containing protein [Clohesyomyces aquaticus]|uniref:RmlC-like cupin domain-containing protein n=1 Tax=Clohesyomyces aquaticus TaxID=1231657 RepID=A0A1Y1Z2W0_9PLEO|nr:RmlC-like cupin domain-containing protein [Clohesyomyces aquaticus]